jgi:integrase
MLERFASHFTAPITSLTSRDLDDWLDGLRDKKGTRLSLRTRRNYRDLVLAVVNFAKSRGYLPREWRVIDDVSDPKLPPVDVHLYTPDELVWLLNIAESHRIGKKKIRFPYQKLVPFIVTTAFAGVRHGEMNEDKVRLLDWSDYDWTAKGIYIGKHTAKTGADRVVDMTDNLIAWLEPYRRKTGRICSLANTSNALCELRKIAAREALQLAGRVGNFEQSSKLREIAKGLSGPKKNALRKSFISYKKALTRDIDAVADQAGNSTGVIRKTYLRSGTRMAVDAERWFSIMPQRADVLPLFTWGGQNVS